MAKHEDLTGKRFGRLTVIKEAGYKIIGKKKPKKKLQWECVCDCGNHHITLGECLKSGTAQSCGCYYKDTRRNKKSYNEYDLDTYTYGVGYCSNGEKFFFDKEDYNKIKDYCWNYDGKYVQAHRLYNDNFTTAIIRLHRLVMDIEDRENINVDHINHIRYDCRKSNLRRCTDEENARNKIECFCTIDNPVGIYLVNNKYNVTIMKKFIGSTDTLEDAIIMRQEYEKKLYGDFRYDPNSKRIIEIA